jgi:hypothetical protein
MYSSRAQSQLMRSSGSGQPSQPQTEGMDGPFRGLQSEVSSPGIILMEFWGLLFGMLGIISLGTGQLVIASGCGVAVVAGEVLLYRFVGPRPGPKEVRVGPQGIALTYPEDSGSATFLVPWNRVRAVRWDGSMTKKWGGPMLGGPPRTKYWLQLFRDPRPHRWIGAWLGLPADAIPSVRRFARFGTVDRQGRWSPDSADAQTMSD